MGCAAHFLSLLEYIAALIIPKKLRIAPVYAPINAKCIVNKKVEQTCNKAIFFCVFDCKEILAIIIAIIPKICAKIIILLPLKIESLANIIQIVIFVNIIIGKHLNFCLTYLHNYGIINRPHMVVFVEFFIYCIYKDTDIGEICRGGAT